MLKAYFKNGAMATKVRAMYGRLLKPEDYARLAEKRSASEVCAYLSNSPSWGAAFAGKTPGEDTAAVLRIFSDTLREEYRRLYRFGGPGDRAVLSLAVSRAERRAARFALTRLCSGAYLDPGDRSYIEPLAEKSHADVDAIAMSATFEDLLENTSRTIYREALEMLPLFEDGLPAFPAADHALESTYYAALYSDLLKNFSAGSTKLLAERVGLEADLLNISGIIRLHRRFPASLKSYAELMIPVRGALTKELADSLAGANNEDSALALLRGTRWAKYFPEGVFADLELISESAMEGFCRGIIAMGEPGAHFAPLYLTLRELEIKKLSRLVVAASYLKGN